VWFSSVEHASGADWDRSAAINIKGHALLTKHTLPYMKAAGGGSIVWQGSISSFLAQVRPWRGGARWRRCLPACLPPVAAAVFPQPRFALAALFLVCILPQLLLLRCAAATAAVSRSRHRDPIHCVNGSVAA
jgi:NAD(P)-dependent dehydrogenase (short-subunit alcohol dehydrogenase family)